MNVYKHAIFNKVNKNKNYTLSVIMPWCGAMSEHSFEDQHKFTSDIQLWWFIIYTNSLSMHSCKCHVIFIVPKNQIRIKKSICLYHTQTTVPVSHSKEPFMCGNLLNMIHDLCCDYLTHANRPFSYLWLNFGSEVPEKPCFPFLFFFLKSFVLYVPYEFLMLIFLIFFAVQRIN